MKMVISSLLLVYSILPAAAKTDTVSFEQLLSEMADLRSLAEYPDPPFLAARFSSYNRVSPVDSVPVWFANYDCGFYLDTLPEGRLMMDAEGPGVITHLWSARSNGSVAFYFDNSETPSWIVPMDTLLKGGGIIRPPFSCVTAQGENCYFPIPYRDRCRIFYRGDKPDLYYQIDYRTYQPHTSLPTFTTAMIDANRALIDSIGAVLSDTADAVPEMSETDAVFSGSIGAQQAVTAVSLAGPGAITAFTVASKEGFNPLFLRQCLIEIAFDGAAYPQVRVPLGDFFSGVPYQNSYRTLPVRITADRTMISRWCMPFRERAVVRLVNHGDPRGSCTVRISTQPYAFTDNTMYFYARWRQDAGVVTSRNLYSIIYMADPLRDHPMLHISGKGVHVGTLLHIWNRESAWWGEGDDKITLDDLPEPNFMGTGTEDYFGYAWSTTRAFSHAFHAQPFAEGFAGFTANARFHISDPQPFTTSYRFDMEIQTAHRPTEIDFGRAVFFYALGAAVTDHDTLTEDDLFLRETQVAVGRESPEASPFDAPIRYDVRRGIMVTVRPVGAREAVVLRVFRADGRIVATDRGMGRRGSVSTAALSAGVYIADASVGGRCRRLRFIVGK